MMQGPRWERLQLLFHDAGALPPTEREDFLRGCCTDDPSLVPEVLELLGADARRFTLLDEGMVSVADSLLARAEVLDGTRIGPYRIIRVLGEGGMGVVYLACRDDLDRQVAIKLLRDAGLSPARKLLFTGEQRTLAQLTHPSITRLYDADVTPEGTPYIVMEYVEGEPLTDYCERHACSVETRLQLFRAICTAVQYAHQHAVIHRDLKPSNVLVRSDGSVSLLDFGIAEHLIDPADARTRSALRMMTPLYTPPEQFAGGIVGVQTDVYALGVILYQLLSGQTPFDVAGCSLAQVERMVMETAAARPSLRGRAYFSKLTSSPAKSRAVSWPELDVLSLKALHRDPSLRYSSVEALIRDLDHYLRHEPLDARPDRFTYRARMFFGRHRLATGAVAVTLLIALMLGGFFTWRLKIAHAAAIEAAARAQRIQGFVTSLIQGGDAEAGPAENMRVVTLLDRGAQEAAGLQSDPALQAEMYQTLGTLYQNVGSLGRADTLLSGALALRRAHPSSAGPGLIASLDALATLRVAQGRLPDADALAREALSFAQTPLIAPQDLARAQVTSGRVQAEQGRYEVAIQTLRKALATSSAPGAAPMDLSTTLRALAAAEYSAGHYDASRAEYERLLALDRKLHGANHPAVADDLGALCAIMQDLGYYPAAEALARESLGITTAYYGADHPKTAAALTQLGRALLYQKKYDPSEAALQQALSIEERDFGPAHATVADTLNELGNLASLRDDYVGAQARFQRVADTYRTIYGDYHYLVAIALSNVAYAKLNLKDYRGAETGFRDVVQRFTETLGAANVNTGIAQIKLGRTLLRERRFQEAEEHTRAGYENLSHQTDLGTSFLQAARKDLVAEYEGLGRSEQSQRYRAELTAHSSSR